MIRKKISFFETGRKVLSDEAKSLQRVLKSLKKNEFNSFCEVLHKNKGNIIFIGIGKSGKVAEKTASTLSSLGKPSFFINAAEASHGDLGAITRKDIAIFLSFSGETEELIDLLPSLNNKKIQILSITGNKASTISMASKSHIHLCVEQEADSLNLAPTSSTTAMMAIGDAIAVSLAESARFKESDFGKNHPGGSLGKNFIKVSQIMIKGNQIPFVNHKKSIIESMDLISKKGLGMALIRDDKKNIKGIFTDGDLRRIINKGINLKKIPIKDVMTKNFKFVYKDNLVVDIARVMEEKKIYSLVVKDSGGKISGLIRMHEILEAKII